MVHEYMLTCLQLRCSVLNGSVVDEAEPNVLATVTVVGKTLPLPVSRGSCAT